MVDNNWDYDTVYFIGQIRRSGGSLVITIPNELRNRFLIEERQIVRIIGVTRRRPHIEGGLLIFLGKFSVIEEVEVLNIVVGAVKEKEETFKEKILDFLINELNATEVNINRKNNDYEITVEFGQIIENEIIPRDEDIANLENKIINYLEDMGYQLKKITHSKSIKRWNNVDPSIIKRYSMNPPKSITFEWKLT